MKNKIILSSILTIALCLSMIAGSTFALFTSESKVDVSVSSATVSVTATATAPEMGSTLGAPLGSATGIGNALTLTNFVPGDYATFSIAIVNASNVAVKYRTVISISDDNGLAKGLVITIGDDVYTNTNSNGELTSTDWTLITTTEGNTSVDVKIALPEEAGNDYQNKTCTLTYFVEAVQGNYVQATKVNNATELKNALVNAESGAIIDASGVTASVADMATSTSGRNTIELSAGVTIKGLTLGFNANNDTILTKSIGENAEIIFDGCTFTGNDFDRGLFLQSGTNTSDVKVVFNNCTFVCVAKVADSNGGGIEFNNCTFKLDSTFGYLQCLGGNVTLNSCAFNYSGAHNGFFNTPVTKHGYINLYSERYNTAVTLNQCTGVPAHHVYNALGGSGTIVTNP